MKSSNKSTENVMRELAKHIENKVGSKYGFCLLIYEHNDSGRMNYVSNSNRQDVIEAMKEFIAKTEDAWGAHKL